MLPVGTILDGRYSITGTLGEGGFATVYRTRHQFLHSTHAIKVLLPHLASDPEMRSRFLSEGRIQAGLRHPNIIPVTDIVTDPAPGLVMEHIVGPTLTELLRERGAALEPAEIASVMLPLLDAVGAAHAAGIVHRDLKPDNILVTTRGTDLWPMVGDFGIAKVLEASALAGGKQKTRTGMRMGTLHYMSPEQIRGASSVDARTDIFSLGAILYECATGQVAFAGDSEFDTMRNIVDGRFDPPERVAAGIGPALAACIQRALAPSADARFQDSASFVTTLRAALATPAVAAARSGRPPPLPPPAAPKAEPRAEPGAEPGAAGRPPPVRDAFRFPSEHSHPDLAGAPAEPPSAAAPAQPPSAATPPSDAPCWFCDEPSARNAAPHVLPLCKLEHGRWLTTEVRIPYCAHCRQAHRHASVVDNVGALGALFVTMTFLGALVDGDFGGLLCVLLGFLLFYGVARAATTSRFRKAWSRYREYPDFQHHLEGGWQHRVPPKA